MGVECCPLGLLNAASSEDFHASKMRKIDDGGVEDRVECCLLGGL